LYARRGSDATRKLSCLVYIQYRPASRNLTPTKLPQRNNRQRSLPAIQYSKPLLFLLMMISFYLYNLPFFTL
jgi:hypothetical protein